MRWASTSPTPRWPGPWPFIVASSTASAFYRDIAVGDFPKQFVLKLVRDLSAEQIQGNFRGRLASADPKLTEQFVSYFGATRAGQDAVLRFVPGVGLESTVLGVVKPTIADKGFADAVFDIWLRTAREKRRSGSNSSRGRVS